MGKEIGSLTNADNVAILDAIWNEAGADYQRRVPQATQAGLESTVGALTDYRPNWNEFVGAFINRIGTIIGRSQSWTNPLAEFKRGLVGVGDTIQEYGIGLLNAHNYDPRHEYMEKALFGEEKPRVESNFHVLNRQEFYKLTVKEHVLRRALITDGELSSFIGDLMRAPITSDNWDEFLITCKLFSIYEANGGFYKVQVPDVAAPASTPDDARKALRIIRGVTETMKFLSTKYNAANLPTFANADELILLTTPEFKAAIDVEALATLFNLERAQINARIVTIPADRFGIDGCQAILTVKDFFVIADHLIENTSQFNPAGLGTNYFWHHWSTISASRFVPAIMFTTKPGSDAVEIEPAKIVTIDDIVATNTDGVAVADVERGFTYQMSAAMTTDPATVVPPQTIGVVWSVKGANSLGTTITDNGVLVVGGNESAESIKITATDSSVDPADPQSVRKFKTETFIVKGDPVPEWPNK